MNTKAPLGQKQPGHLYVKVIDGWKLIKIKSIYYIRLIDRKTEVHWWCKSSGKMQITKSTERLLNSYDHLLENDFVKVTRAEIANENRMVHVGNDGAIQFDKKVSPCHFFSPSNLINYFKRI